MSTKRIIDLPVTTDISADDYLMLDGATNSTRKYPFKTIVDAIEDIESGTGLDDGAVSTDIIANGAVTNAKLATDSVGTSNIQNGSVTLAKIASGSEATTSASGLMSVTDKAKLDEFSAASSYALKSDIVGAYIFKGSVTNASDLPATGMETGHVYNIINASVYGSAGTNVAWNGTEWDALGEAFEIANGSITSDKLANTSVTASKLANQAVATAKIEDGAITNGKIANDAVTISKIADGAVVTSKIANSTITTDKIADGNVTTAKIADANVTTAKIADGGVITDKISNGAVTTAKIANGGVVTDKIADAAVTTNKIANSNVTTAKIADGGVITDKISNGAVTTAKIANGGVVTDKIADAAVTTNKIANSNVTTAKIADGGITTTKIQDGGVVTSKIADDAVTTDKIADGSVTLDKLATDVSDEFDDIHEELDLKADADGYYSQLTAGLAENLIGRGDAVPAEYLYRTAGGTADISDGIATIDCIKGNTLVWNQMARVAVRTVTSKGITYTASSDGSITVSGTATGRESFQLYGGVAYNIQFIGGHKYLISGASLSNKVSMLAIVERAESMIFECSSDTSAGLSIITFADFDGTYTCYPQLFDLTLMFGAGNEPETVEEFEALFPLPYYPYSAPKLLNVDMRGVETVGFNLLPGSLEYGTGFTPDFDKSKCVRLIAGNQYQFSVDEVVGATSWRFVLPLYYLDGSKFTAASQSAAGVSAAFSQISYSCYYDGNVIVGNSNSTFKSFTFTPAQDMYLRIMFRYGDTTTSTIMTNPCVHLVWSGYRNGEYEEYWSSERPIDTSRFFPTGLKKVGDKADALYADHYDTVIGSVDLGTLNWTKGNATNDGTGVVFHKLKPTDASVNNNISCAAFTHISAVNPWEKATLGDIFMSATSLIVVGNPSYTTAEDFKAAMSGVILYYELATPTTTPIDPPLNLSYKVSDFGTERIMVDETADAPQTAPVPMEVEYGLNAIDTIRRLPTNYIPRDELEPKLDEKADVDGYYSTMTVGAADNLTGRGDGASGQYLYRTAGGDEDIADGVANIRSIKGQTLVWNQMVLTPYISTSGTTSGLTSTVDDDWTVTISGESTGGTNFYFNNDTNSRAVVATGHKYLISGIERSVFSGTDSSSRHLIIYYDGAMRHAFGEDSIFEAVSSGKARVYVNIPFAGITVDFKGRPQLFDLTQMFGEGNEPSTVAEFEALFQKPYYPYSEPTLLSVNMEGIETVGFNQWDEEWEVGTYSTANGNKASAATGIRSTNMVPVMPSTQYHMLAPHTSVVSGFAIVLFYGMDGAYLNSYVQAASNGSVFTTPSDAHYLTFYVSSLYGTTYKGDISINLSWSGYRNGEYEEYWKSQREIPAETYFPDGMRSAGTFYDELVQSLNFTKAITRVGAVDLGTLTWRTTGRASGSTPPDSYFYTTGLTGLKANGNTNLRCALYTATEISPTIMPDKSIKGNASNGNIFVVDSSYSTQDEFTAAMSGVMLYYELAEPTEVTIEPPLNLSYKVSDFGTEKVMVDEEADAPQSAPPIIQTAYGINATDTVRRLPTQYISHESFQQFVAALQSAVGITVTETWDENDGRYEYTVTQTGE